MLNCRGSDRSAGAGVSLGADGREGDHGHCGDDARAGQSEKDATSSWPATGLPPGLGEPVRPSALDARKVRGASWLLRRLVSGVSLVVAFDRDSNGVIGRQRSCGPAALKSGESGVVDRLGVEPRLLTRAGGPRVAGQFRVESFENLVGALRRAELIEKVGVRVGAASLVKLSCRRRSAEIRGLVTPSAPLVSALTRILKQGDRFRKVGAILIPCAHR